MVAAVKFVTERGVAKRSLVKTLVAHLWTTLLPSVASPIDVQARHVCLLLGCAAVGMFGLQSNEEKEMKEKVQYFVDCAVSRSADY